MCIIVEPLELGAADALLDLEAGLLVLRPTLTRPEQVAACRKALRAAGVRQSLVGVTCRCGGVLTLPASIDPSTPRLSRAVSLLTAGVVAILGAFVTLPQAANAEPDPYDTQRWRETSTIALRECAYHGATAECASPWGVVEVRAWKSGGRAEYLLALPAGAVATLRVFPDTGERDRWVHTFGPGSAAVGERTAYVGPDALAHLLGAHAGHS